MGTKVALSLLAILLAGVLAVSSCAPAAPPTPTPAPKPAAPAPTAAPAKPAAPAPTAAPKPAAAAPTAAPKPAAPAPTQPAAKPKPQDSVTVRLDWLPTGYNSLIFVGREKGFFAEQGVNVERVVVGDGSANAVKLVGSGEFNFAFADSNTVINGRTKGVPVVGLAAVHQKSAWAILSWKESGIAKPTDLYGKTLGNSPGSASFVFWKAFARLAKLDADRVKQAAISPPYDNYLKQRTVDALIVLMDDSYIPLMQEFGAAAFNAIEAKEYGYEHYGHVLFTNDTMIKEKPDVVGRFVKGYIKTLDYVIKNKGETGQFADMVIKNVPNTNKKALEGRVSADIQTYFTSKDTDANGLGWINESRMAALQDMLMEQGVIEKKVPVSELFTTRFLK